MGIRQSLMVGFALAIGLNVASRARDFEMGGDNSFPYSIMAPERGPVPHRHRKSSVKKRHGMVPHYRSLTKKPPRTHFSIVRGSPGVVLPTPLPRTKLIPPEGGSGRLMVPALPQEQGPTVVPGIANPVPNLPHGTETFQDRASRCAFQQGLYNVPGNMSTQYMGACLQ
jgi:hypothetical protein